MQENSTEGYCAFGIWNLELSDMLAEHCTGTNLVIMGDLLVGGGVDKGSGVVDGVVGERSCVVDGMVGDRGGVDERSGMVDGVVGNWGGVDEGG